MRYTLLIFSFIALSAIANNFSYANPPPPPKITNSEQIKNELERRKEDRKNTANTVLSASDKEIGTQRIIDIYEGHSYEITRNNNLRFGDQIDLHSTDKRKPTKLEFDWMSYFDIHASITQLNVYGYGALSFGNPRAARYFYLEDLFIDYGFLEIEGWKDGLTRIMVKKDSWSLHKSLSKIHFKENDSWHALLRDYNNDYWEIIAAVPEPATTGALLGAVGIGLWTWKRKQRAKYSTV